ncbi:MAG: hypothetical protein ACRDL4_09980, partial [Thermoleophilaceae bacterium]
GLTYADDLPERHPDVGNLERFAGAHHWNSRNRSFLPLSEWLPLVFFKTCYPRSPKVRGEGSKRVPFDSEDDIAAVVGFNLPFDLSRIASGAWQARSKQYAGGFAFTLMDRPPTYRDENGEPRRPGQRYPDIHLKPLDSRKAKIAFAHPKPDYGSFVRSSRRNKYGDFSAYYDGVVVDLAMLHFALTGSHTSLASAAKMWGTPHKLDADDRHGSLDPEYLEYAHGDIRATLGLAERLFAEYESHGLTVPVNRIMSTASLGKAMLRGADVPRSCLPPWISVAGDERGRRRASHARGTQ